jgi:hypothetical protein
VRDVLLITAMRDLILTYAPLLVLVLLLVCGRYPGEARILRLGRRRACPRPRRVAVRPVVPVFAVRSRLERAAMSGRGPPRAAPGPLT